MTRPQRYLNRMIYMLVGVVIITIVLAPALASAFTANVFLNSAIMAVLVLGIAYVFRQVLMLRPAVQWLVDHKREDRDTSDAETPALLGPMATLMAERQGRLSLSTTSMRSLLDSIGARLDEEREISRYVISLLIFLGLLGTFWGLLQTIGSISTTIDTLNVSSGDFALMFDELKTGLKEPLGGMGTAFSSSLFGLAGSVVLGLLDLQAGQAQNRFYNDLEEWLSGITRLSGAGASLGDGEQSVPAYVTALLEQTAETVDNLQRTFARSEEGRNDTNRAVLALTEKLGSLADIMAKADNGLDEASREHLRNLDVHMGQMQQHLTDNRNALLDELRSEIKLLARTVAGAIENRQ
jgi:biopolymer transport protein ExbB/TolQ